MRARRLRSTVESAYPRITEYAIIGDCHTAALIARDGSIDWYCPDRFDAAAVFCRLLDTEKGGYLRVAPTRVLRSERRYVGPTNVLETTLFADTGHVRLTDCMPIFARPTDGQGCHIGTHNRVLRRLECVSGEVCLSVEFRPTFDYAGAPTALNRVPGGGAIAQDAEASLMLMCPGVSLHSDGRGGVRGRLRMRAGERRWLVITSDKGAVAPAHECEQQLATTLQTWQQWTSRCTYRGPYRELVLRSALVLKLLTYDPSGAVIAAPTTSLPEKIGAGYNWDYRFTWLRDSSLIADALLSVGYRAESADFLHFLERTLGSDSTREPQIMYGIDGRRILTEHVLDHLEGYRGSRPVRVGNAAAGQRQIDIYGEVLRAAALHYVEGPEKQPQPRAWRVLRGLVDDAGKHWSEEGSGLWEVRGRRQAYLYGKLMCWVALDRGLQVAQRHRLEAPLNAWRGMRDELGRVILERGFNRDLATFTEAFGSTALDASALVIPRIGLLSATDPRMLSTIEQIQRHLTRGGLVYRTSADLERGAGTFTLCTFWLVQALALAGRVDEAEASFDRAAGCVNDLGLLAEEIDPGSGEQLGNFPQGFSHLGMIGAALMLGAATDRH